MLLDWSILLNYFPFLLEGTVLTLQISLLALALGLLFGFLAAIIKLSSSTFIRSFATFYIWIIRSTPLLIQLFIIYFGLPQFGVDLGPFWSGVLGLSLNVGAYNAEAIRGGIQAIAKGQWEACYALGMSPATTLRRIILPQAFRIALPSLGNNFVILIKDTSLVSTITLVELTLTAQRLISSSFKPFEIYLMAAVLYAALTSAVSFLVSHLETRTGRFAHA